MSETSEGGAAEPRPAKPAGETVHGRNPIRRIYDWTLAKARTPQAVPVLAAVSFSESSFFIVPPDLLQIAMGTANPKRSFHYAALSMVMSALGGVFGYFIGYWLWDHVSHVFFRIPGFTPELFRHVSGLYNQYGVEIVMVAGFTPIPYKVFTIASGVANMNLLAFFAASVVSRGARFFIVAAITYWFGARVQEIMDRHFNRIVWGGGVALVALYLLVKALKG